MSPKICSVINKANDSGNLLNTTYGQHVVPCLCEKANRLVRAFSGAIERTSTSISSIFYSPGEAFSEFVNNEEVRQNLSTKITGYSGGSDWPDDR